MNVEDIRSAGRKTRLLHYLDGIRGSPAFNQPALTSLTTIDRPAKGRRPLVLVIRRAGLLTLASIGLLLVPGPVLAGSASLDPPTIAAVCTPPGPGGGCDGWFTTNVDVSFSWSIPADETFWSENGCNAFSVTSDTLGVSYSCTVTVASRSDPSTTISKTITGSIKRDSTPPVLKDVQVSAGPNGVALTWTVAADAVLVEVTRSPGPRAALYRGLAGHFTDSTVQSRAKYAYTVAAFDAAGNKSSQTVSVTLRDPLFAPARGGLVGAPPTLAWKKDPKASYYNVQLFLGSKKVLSAWPLRPWLVLHRKWTYKGSVVALKRGRYRWYVWPGYGDLARKRFGKLIGTSTFVVER